MTLVRNMAVGLAGIFLTFGMNRAALAASEVAPDFKEVYDLVSAHLEGQTPDSLNRAAVEGLLKELKGRAWIVTNDTVASTSVSVATNQFEFGVLDIKAPVIESGLAKTITDTLATYTRSNKLSGVVLDLRFSSGSGYAEAAAVADLFLDKEVPLMDWGTGVVRSKAKTNSITCPLVILVNHDTSGAAEALAAILRAQDRTLLIGGSSAGLAVITQDYPLKDGRKLRVATAGIKLGGGEVVSREGVTPDIAVALDAQIEHVFYEDPFKDALPTAVVLPSLLQDIGVKTNGTAAAHAQKNRPLNEAELMRERKERPGVDVDDLPLRQPTKDLEPEKPIIRDPVLGRALDLIKGLAAFRRNPAP